MDSLSVPPVAEDPLDVDLREVDVAIRMVRRGSAVRIRLVGLRDPDAIAPIALARAQRAGVDFRVDRAATTRLIIGPSNVTDRTGGADVQDPEVLSDR